MAGILSFKTVKKCGLDKISYSPVGIMLGVVQTISVLILFTFVIIYPELFRLIYTISHGRYLFFPGFNYYALSFEVAGVMFIYLVAAMFLGRIAYCGRGNLWFIWLNLVTMVSMFLGFIISTACVLLYGLIDIDPANGTAIAQAWDYLGLYWHVAGMKYCFVIFTFAVTGVQVAIRRTFGTGAQKTSGNFGSAKFADSKHLKEKGALSIKGSNGEDKAIVYGTLGGKYIGSNDIEPRLVVAPQRKGKSTCVSVPFLLDCPYNTFVLDVKGELFLTTYKQREAMGKKPIAIDIFGVLDQFGDFSKYKVSGCDILNVGLGSTIDRERYLQALCDALLIMDDDFGNNKHFSDAAHNILRGVLDGFIDSGYSLKHVYDRVILKSCDDFIHYLEELNDDLKSRYLATGIAYLKKPSKKERGGMETTFLRCFEWLVGDTTSTFFGGSGFNVNDFVHANADIFVIMPVDMVKRYARVVRLLIAIVGSAILRSPMSKLHKRYPFLLDEIAQLKYFPYIEEIIETGGGYGMRVLAIFQTLDQIRKYKKPDLFESMPVKQFFGTTDIKTMDWIKRLGGMQTIRTESSGESMSQKPGMLGNPASSSTSNSMQETGVSLIHDDHIMVMPFEKQWLFINEHRPITCNKVIYFMDKRYKGKFKSNPIEER